MRKRISATILIGAIVLAALVCCVASKADSFFGQNSVILGNVIVTSEDDWDEIIASHTAAAMDRNAVAFNGGTVAYEEESNTFYLPQDLDSDSWEGILSSYDDAQIRILDEDVLYDRATALQDGYSFSCLYVNQDSYCPFSLVFTGVSTLSLFYGEDEVITTQKEDHDGELSVQGTDGSYEYSLCVFHIRGQASLDDDKKCYKINLKTTDGENNDLALLGMRSDDDWILNAQYRDGSRIREPLAYAVWEEMQTLSGCSTSYTSHNEFVEVFFNDEYMGLYALQEPLDGKTYDLEDGDILYYIKKWLREENASSVWDQGLSQFNGQDTVPSAEIKWPKESEELKWDALQMIYEFYKGGMSWEEFERSGVKLEPENLALFNLFVTLVRADDTLWKNTFIACFQEENGTYTAEVYPWDMNASFGDNYKGEFREETASETERSRKDSDSDPNEAALWEAYVRDCPEEASSIIATEWKTLRDAGFSSESVCQSMQEMWAQVLSSGAIFREAERWPGTIDGNDYTNMLTWVETRFDTFDAMYGYSAE